MKRGKKYRAAQAKYDLTQKYAVLDACKMVQDMKYANFDETVEAHVSLKLGKNMTVRDTLVFPNQFTAEKKVLVFCKEDRAKEALDAGATYAGADEYIEKVKGGWLDFDIAVATPDMMKDVGRLGMVLGRRGLMPNPKTGTVTLTLEAKEELFEQVLNEMIDIDITDKSSLLGMFQEYKETKTEFESIKSALKRIFR